MATPNNEYIVFEPDQVLTDTDLNEQFNYLDQQERWTRNKLLGIGIACGLDLVQHTGVIEITKGCGVTSEGYLILQEDKAYAYYIPYAALPQPNDLPFTYPGHLPFFQPFCDDVKPVYLLLTDEEYGKLDATQQPSAQLLSKLGGLGDWLVVLFLEVREKDMANCDTNDCDNKGERMIFTVRPLLVNRKTWKRGNTNGGGSTDKAPEIRLKRYNVPVASLQNSTEVLNGFLQICDDTTLKQVEGACNWCFQAYADAATPPPFAAGQLKTLRDNITATAPLQLEYFYDFVNDLILAYYEIREAARGRATRCCPDELLFPLHLILGEADHTTTGPGRDAYRQYFLYSGLFSRQDATGDRLAMLLRRMQVMVAGFAVPESRTIRITPSQYQEFPLSRRAIPWYYTGKKDDPASVYQYWNFEKTSEGNAAFNLSYNAHFYNSDPAIVQPLLYDIERYHFFRIEGHIGQTYTTALKDLLGQRSQFNLPFEIVAVSAEMLKLNTAQLPECNIHDLITDYRLLLTAFACRVHTVFCFLTKAPYAAEAKELNAYLATYDAFKQAAARQETALSLPFDNTKYAKGDFMRLFCPPAANDTTRIGAVYLANMADNRAGDIPRPVQYIYFFIDLVESLMLRLIPGQLSALASTDLISDWRAYIRSVYNLGKTEEAAKLGADSSLPADTLALAAVCFDEELLAIYREYIRRLAQFQAQLSFLQYFRKHPGLEHKAGVPKGGTFVLVYHAPEQRPVLTGVAGNEVLLADTAALRAARATASASMATLSVADYEALSDFVTQCKDAPSDQQNKVISILTNYRPSIEAKGYNIGPGIVIADFYIPYLCCSDCAPVAYVLQPDQPATVFDLEPRTFLSDDAHDYQFQTTPPVTTANKEQKPFVAPGVVDNPKNLNLWTDAQNNLYLHPADDSVKATFDAEVSYAGTTIKITIIKADASFKMTTANDEAGRLQATVTADHTDAAEYKWTRNGEKALDSQPSGTFPANHGDTVELTIVYALNGAVSNDTKSQLIPSLIQ